MSMIKIQIGSIPLTMILSAKERQMMTPPTILQILMWAMNMHHWKSWKRKIWKPIREHPPYSHNSREGAAYDYSTNDSSTPYVGDEYAPLEELEEEDLEDNNMHIEGESIVRVSKEDEELSKDAEDDRDDLDEEGYPKYEGD